MVVSVLPDGNPLQCSCLENPRDGGAWWAAVCGVAESRTRLKQLSSSRLHLWRLPHFLPHGPLGLLCFLTFTPAPSLLPSAASLCWLSLPSSLVKGSHVDIEPFLIQDNFLILKSITLILSIKSLLLYSQGSRC